MNVLLHLCCANCAIFPVRVMRENNLAVTGLFFNNNIHPYQEFRRRLETVRDYAARVELEVHVNEDYQLDSFLQQVAGDPAKRCEFCYRSRLEETARFAAEHRFDAFSSTLLYSRYQQHDRIREIGNALASKYEIPFHYQDFRSGWHEGIQVSKTMGLYRQQYCGCIYSERDRYSPRSRN